MKVKLTRNERSIGSHVNRDRKSYLCSKGYSTMTDIAPEESTQPLKSYSYGNKSVRAQCFATFVISITFFGNGLFIALPTVIVGNLLNSKHDSLSLNEEEASWFGGMPFLVQPFGALMGILLQDYVSQKYGLFVSNTLSLTFYLMLYFATQTSTVLLSAVIMGISQGFTEPSTMSYISEFSEAKLRGSLSSGALSMMSIAQLFEFIVVSLVDWRTALLVNGTVHIASLLLLSLIPDSPIWLLSKNKKDKALKSLRWYRGGLTADKVQEEFHELNDYVKSSLMQSHIVVGYHDQEERSILVKKTNFVQKFRTNVSELVTSVLERRTLYPLLLITFTSIIHCFAGSLGARVYSMNLFESLKTPLNKNWITVSSSVANVAGGITVVLVLKYTGKRKLAIVTFFLTSMMSIYIGIYFYVKDQVQLPWLFIPSFFVLVYVASQGIGIPWLLMGEIFPVRTRNAGSGLFAIIFDFVLFFFFKTYFTINRVLGTPMYFIVHGLIGMTGTLVLYWCMPETEGKSLAEIERIFLKK